MATLSEENVKNLYRCETKRKRRDVLANILNYSSFEDNEDDIKTSVLLDFYAESIHFARERGFSWQQGLAVFELMKELLTDTLDLSLLQATEHLKKILKSYTKIFPSHRMTSVIDFVFSFFFNHFHLYKFVFTNERDVDKRITQLNVETPPQDLPSLVKGTEKSEWERQQALKKLEDERQKKLMEKQLQLDSEVERLQSLVHDQLTLLNTEQPITAEDLKKIVEETVQMYVASAGSTMQHLVEESQEKLMYEFEKTAVEHTFDRNVKTSSRKTQSPRTALKQNKKKAKESKTGNA